MHRYTHQVIRLFLFPFRGKGKQSSLFPVGPVILILIFENIFSYVPNRTWLPKITFCTQAATHICCGLTVNNLIISSFSFGFQSTQISEKNERTILSRELTHRTNMTSSYYWFTVFCHEQSSKSACDRGIGIASLREHRYHWSSNK